MSGKKYHLICLSLEDRDGRKRDGLIPGWAAAWERPRTMLVTSLSRWRSSRFVESLKLGFLRVVGAHSCSTVFLEFPLTSSLITWLQQLPLANRVTWDF